MPPSFDPSASPAGDRLHSRRDAPGTGARATATGRSLDARLRWVLFAVVLVCLLNALLVQQWAARDALIQQLARHNGESAAWLALALDADTDRSRARRDDLMAMHAARARLQLVQLRTADGRVVWQQRSETRPAHAPALYARLLDLNVPAATAPVRGPDGQAGGSVLVSAHAGDATDALWRGLWQTALALAVLGGLVMLGAASAAAKLRRLVSEAVAQTDAFRDGPGGRVAIAALPELQPLADSMNRLAGRVQAMYEVSAGELESLRQQVHLDPVTGLLQRRHFMARLEQSLLGDQASGHCGLLLLRVSDLAGMNRRLGHAGVDQMLQTVGQVLHSYPHRADGCFAGRLNGADFGLVLPVSGLAEETADALVRSLRMPLVTLDGAVALAAGAVELRGACTAQQALAMADEALCRAEAQRPFTAVCISDAQAVTPYGEAMWQQRLAMALEQGRVALAEFPVCTADGRVLHLDCPLRIQIEPGGTYEPAARWLAQAARARLSAAVDERAVELALQAIDADGRARCVNVSAHSLGVSDFMAAVSRRLEASPQAATRLWIDLPEALALDRPALVQEASRRWRPLGVYIGLEHAGEGLARIHRLIELGLDCVRVDARFVAGLAEPEANPKALRYLRGLVQLVQSVGMSITAEGVRTEEDLALLWSLGFDAATGPVLAARDAGSGAALPSEAAPQPATSTAPAAEITAG
jgi:predicted signal transduction protein with EAL and GGDEF domain